MSNKKPEIAIVVALPTSTGDADARAMVEPFLTEHDLEGVPVVLDLRLRQSPDVGFVTGALSRLAEIQPERVVVLGAGPAVEMFVSAAEMRFEAVAALAARGALWVVEDRDDLVTDLPEHSPLDESLFELFMQYEPA